MLEEIVTIALALCPVADVVRANHPERSLHADERSGPDEHSLGPFPALERAMDEAAMEADGVDALLHVVTQEWPLILRIDAVALALIIGDKGFRADGNGVQMVEPRLLQRAVGEVNGVEMRTVERGHPLFGPACDLIRAEALVRIDCEPPLPLGLLAIGQRAELSLDARHGSELLMFLGRSLAAIIRRWLIEPKLA